MLLQNSKYLGFKLSDGSNTAEEVGEPQRQSHKRETSGSKCSPRQMGDDQKGSEENNQWRASHNDLEGLWNQT